MEIARNHILTHSKYEMKHCVINSSQVHLLLVIKVCVDISFSDTSLEWIACPQSVNLTTTTTLCAKLIVLRYKQNSFCNLSNIWVVNRNKMTPWELDLIKKGNLVMLWSCMYTL